MRAHPVLGLDVEGYPRDHTDCAQADDHPVEVGIPAAGLPDISVRGHELEPGNRGREVAIAIARPVRPRRHRAGHRDMR